MSAPVLDVAGLSVSFPQGDVTARVVDDVSFSVLAGQIVGLIGESGSGKTTVALALLHLLPRGAVLTGGDLRLNGVSIVGLDERSFRQIRGSQIAYIPQNAMSSFNPLIRVDVQVGEPFRLHRKRTRTESRQEAVRLLGSVHIREPEKRARDYPHRLSGGMLQRAMTAMALALQPPLIIADEPTSALDVTIQAQILRLFKEVRDTHGTSMLIITHDLGVVAEACDAVVVIYAGRVLETGPVQEVLAHPQHPYTQGLINATPRVDSTGSVLVPIPGQLPSPSDLPKGCRFADRCPKRFAKCADEPPLVQCRNGQWSRCWLAES